MGVKLGTLERVDVTLHGIKLALHTLQEHFPHLARRDFACLLFCARAVLAPKPPTSRAAAGTGR